MWCCNKQHLFVTIYLFPVKIMVKMSKFLMKIMAKMIKPDGTNQVGCPFESTGLERMDRVGRMSVRRPKQTKNG